MDNSIIFEDLFLTVHTGDFEALKTLLSREGATAPVENLDVRDSEGSTPLIYCVKGAGTRGQEPNEHHLECCKLLVSAEVLLDAVDQQGKSVLHWCVSYQLLDILVELVNLGARLDVVDSDGNNPLHFAILRGSIKCVEVISELASPQILEAEDPHGRTPLIHACMDGKGDICHLLLQAGANPNAVSSFALAKSAVHFAARLDSVSTLDMLIKYRADLKAVDNSGASVFHQAACARKSVCLSLLTGLCGYECLEQKDSEGKTVLMYACEAGNMECVEFLLDHKVSLTSVDNEGKSCLHYCASNPTSDIIKLICTLHPQLVFEQDNSLHTALHEAISEGNLVSVRALLEMGSDITMTDSELHSPVHWATVFGHADCIKVLAKYGAEVNTPDIYGACPLHYAAELYGLNQQHDDTSSKTLKALLDCGVDAQCTDSDERQPIHWAASAGNSLACKLLVDSGVCVNTTCNDGLTALHLSSSCGHSACVGSLLLDCGANPDSVDDHGCTPLFYAVTMGHVECVEILLQFGSLINVQDHSGKSPAHFAASQGQLQCLQLLCHYGGALSLASNEGDTPLHEAIYNQHIDIVKFLLQQGCNVNIRNKQGIRPLHAAASIPNEELCHCLIGAKADINSVLITPEGKYVTACDLAMMKSGNACSQLLQQNDARTGTNITSAAAATIRRGWLRYKAKKYGSANMQDMKDNSAKTINMSNEEETNCFERVFHDSEKECGDLSLIPCDEEVPQKVPYSFMTKISMLDRDGSWSVKYDKHLKATRTRKEASPKSGKNSKKELDNKKHDDYWTLKCPKLRESEEYKQLREDVKEQYQVKNPSNTKNPELKKFYKKKEEAGTKALEALDHEAALAEERVRQFVEEQQSVIDHFRRRHKDLRATIKQTSKEMDRNIMLAKQILNTTNDL